MVCIVKLYDSLFNTQLLLSLCYYNFYHYYMYNLYGPF